MLNREQIRETITAYCDSNGFDQAVSEQKVTQVHQLLKERTQLNIMITALTAEDLIGLFSSIASSDGDDMRMTPQDVELADHMLGLLGDALGWSSDDMELVRGPGECGSA